MFSTPFFGFAEHGLEVSKEFWIYWVIVVPLTLAVVLVWWWWLGGSYKKIKAKLLHTSRNKVVEGDAQGYRPPVVSKTWG
jgi:hypothetical protein